MNPSSPLIALLAATSALLPAHAAADRWPDLGRAMESGSFVSLPNISKAAYGGFAGAQRLLGHFHAVGECVDRDDHRAFEVSKPAAEGGDRGAQSNLGCAFAHGRGVAEDDREAVAWNRKAAEQGHAGAQSILSAQYAPDRCAAKDGSASNRAGATISAHASADRGGVKLASRSEGAQSEILQVKDSARFSTCQAQFKWREFAKTASAIVFMADADARVIDDRLGDNKLGVVLLWN